MNPEAARAKQFHALRWAQITLSGQLVTIRLAHHEAQGVVLGALAHVRRPYPKMQYVVESGVNGLSIESTMPLLIADVAEWVIRARRETWRSTYKPSGISRPVRVIGWPERLRHTSYDATFAGADWWTARVVPTPDGLPTRGCPCGCRSTVSAGQLADAYGSDGG